MIVVTEDVVCHDRRSVQQLCVFLRIYIDVFSIYVHCKKISLV